MLRSGWTLLELMVVLALTSIIARFASQPLITLWLRQQARLDRQKITGLFVFARAMALLEGRAMLLCPSRDASHCASRSARYLLVTDTKHHKPQAVARLYGHIVWRHFHHHVGVIIDAEGQTLVSNGTLTYLPHRGQRQQLILNRAGLLHSKAYHDRF